MKFNSLSLNVKITLILVLFLIGTLTVGGMGLWGTSRIDDSMEMIVKVLGKRVTETSNLRGAFRMLVIHEKNAILESNRAKADERIDELNKSHKELLEKFTAVNNLLGDEGKVILKEARDNYEAYWKNAGEVIAALQKSDNKRAVEFSLIKGPPLRSAVEGDLDRVIELNKSKMQKASDESDALAVEVRKVSIWSIVIAAALCGIIAFFVMRALNQAISSVIDNLKDNSNQVSSAAQQIASTSEELSSASTEQASSLQETSSAVEEMSAMISRNSENAQQSKTVAGESQQVAGKGRQVVSEMLAAVSEISRSNQLIMEQTDESNRQFTEIVKVIHEIGEKTKVINDIVFQTKLLSFNASVEAARAGEHGKGFAVVAEEVGHLAAMSGNAAHEITQMLDSSTKKVESIVNQTKTKISTLIEEAKRKVEVGTKVANECNDVLSEIEGNVSRMAEMSSEVSHASREQSQGIQEINRAMTQLDQVTQQNASSSEETASAAEQLASQAQVLKSVVETLVQTIYGANSLQEANHFQPRMKAERTPPRAKTSTSPAPKLQMMSFAKKAEKTETEKAPSLKKAVGSSQSFPAENDPRFEEL